MPGEHVLIFGGNGRIARSMTKLMLARSWNVTSVIRSPGQEESILQLGKDQPGMINVVIANFQDIKSPDDAAKIPMSVKPTAVVFAAGSYGNPYAIDRDAAKRIIKASTNAPYVTKFLNISFPAARRDAAPWWDKKDVQNWQQEKSTYPDIAEAKLQADEYLVAMRKARKVQGGLPFQAISLRPSWFVGGPSTGQVSLGKGRALGQIRMGDVALVAVSLLARDDTNGWYDLLQGSDSVESAIDMCVSDGVNCIEGEDLDRIYKLKD